MDENKLREIFDDIENTVLLKKIRELFKIIVKKLKKKIYIYIYHKIYIFFHYFLYSCLINFIYYLFKQFNSYWKVIKY